MLIAKQTQFSANNLVCDQLLAFFCHKQSNQKHKEKQSSIFVESKLEATIYWIQRNTQTGCSGLKVVCKRHVCKSSLELALCSITMKIKAGLGSAVPKQHLPTAPSKLSNHTLFNSPLTCPPSPLCTNCETQIRLGALLQPAAAEVMEPNGHMSKMQEPVRQDAFCPPFLVGTAN